MSINHGRSRQTISLRNKMTQMELRNAVLNWNNQFGVLVARMEI